MNWFIKTITQNYANFSGRAQRAEYWYFTLFVNLAMTVLTIGAVATSGPMGEPSPVFSILQAILVLGLIIPGLGVQIRRLHDIGKSGWFWLVNFVPCVGPFIVLIWAVQDSDPGDNQYGPNPKGIGGPAPAAEDETGKAEDETGKAEDETGLVDDEIGKAESEETDDEA